MKAVCEVCPHRCALSEGQTGLCKARANRGGKIVSLAYGKLTAIALDPIEKKPLYMYAPGSKILSVGSFGCNLACPFCQNCDISMRGNEGSWDYVSPEGLVKAALHYVPEKNIGIAYTYNEPITDFEYVIETSKLAREAGLKNAIVTNGYANEKPFLELIENIDAANIDLKGFSEECYKKLGGTLAPVLENIRAASKRIHVEVTTLIVPGLNDDGDMMEKEAKWLSGLDPNMPLHITRFFPRYKMQGEKATPLADLNCLYNIAKKYLNNVFLGNC